MAAPVRVLITGGFGFIGRWLAADLARQGHEVWLNYYVPPPRNEPPPPGIAGSVGFDVRNREPMDAALREIRPQRIYHLAAQSFPALSWRSAHYTLDANVLGTVNLFDAVRELKLDARILVACSSAEYGIVSADAVPTKEDHPLHPLHPYGVSKVAQDLLSYQEHVTYGTKVVRVRIFNTTGPGKQGDVCADFTRRVAEIELGRREATLPVGNLQPRRAFCDVRDMVKALQAALEKGKPGEVYNACATEAVTVQHALDLILELSKSQPQVVVDPDLLRPTDEPIILGDTTRLRKATGWVPEVPLRQTLDDMLHHWRRVLAG